MDIILKLNELLKKEDFREELCTLIEKHLYHSVPAKEETGVLKELLDEEQHQPKFKVGDWIVDDLYGKVNQVILENGDGFTLDDNTYFSGCWEDYYHLWTIQDAKDGDILIANEDSEYKWYGIFKKHTGETFTSYCHYNHGTAEFVTAPGRCKNHGYGKWGTIHPANKVQRHTLFAEIKRAGYTWDAEKKELKKIQKRWRDDEEAALPVGFKIESGECLTQNFNMPNNQYNQDHFATEAQARSAIAMARISQIMANDPRFGGVVTDEEWEDYNMRKYVLYRNDNNVDKTDVSNSYYFLAFHTEEQRDLFLSENRDLVEDYLMISKKGE